MIPMVFWASLPPCPRLKAAAETSCKRRKMPSTRRGAERWNSQVAATISRNARSRPNSGDSTMNRMVLRMLSAASTAKPALATPAPAKPPMSACDDEVGSPNHQVRRFQAMAPTRPAKTTASLTTCASTVLPTVLATWVLNTMKATKLKTAAQITATRGVSTLVETTVAIELAASWKPLVKSNSSASATIAATTVARPSGMLEHDALDRVGHVLERVHRLLELLDDVLPDQQVAGGVLGLEGVQVRPCPPVQAVGLVLELVDPDPVGAQLVLGELAQVPQARRGLAGGLVEQPRLLAHRLDGLEHLVQHQHVGGRLDRVGDVVQLGRQVVDVLAVERGDEGGVEPREDRVGDAVALVLLLGQAFGLHLRVDEVVDHVAQERGSRGDAVGGRVEEIEEGLLARKDTQLHLLLPSCG